MKRRSWQLTAPLSPLAVGGCVLVFLGGMFALLNLIGHMLSMYTIFISYFAGYVLLFLCGILYAAFTATVGRKNKILCLIPLVLFLSESIYDTAKVIFPSVTIPEDAAYYFPLMITSVLLIISLVTALVLAVLFYSGRITPVPAAIALLASLILYLVNNFAYKAYGWGQSDLDWKVLMFLAFCVGAALVLFSYKKMPNPKEL